jgi:hypothetical protein
MFLLPYLESLLVLLLLFDLLLPSLSLSIPSSPPLSTPPLTPSSSPRVLLTGGSGYIGSHTALELLKRGINVVIADNLSNSKVESCNR